MQIKTCPVTVKAAGEQDGLEEGVVEAIVATYDVDSVGDQIIPGAFRDTIAEYKASGHPIPFIWSHKSDDPNYHIGTVLDAEERPGVGLWVKAQIDTDEPVAQKIYRLLKGRRVVQYSFAYDELDARPASEKSAPGALKELHRLKVYEVGPTPIGANQNTFTLDVKHAPAPVVSAEWLKQHAKEEAAKLSDTAAELKAGRVLSKQNEDRVAEIARLASELLASVKADQPPEDTTGAPGSSDEKATPAQPADESPAVKATDPLVPARPGTASARLRTDLELMELEVASYTI